MRILIDANIFISYMLSHKEGTINKLIKIVTTSNIKVILPEELIKKVDLSYAYEVLDLFQSISISPQKITSFPSISRDKKDNYLLAYAVQYNADYLITDDKDLIDLGPIENLQILTPKQFLELIVKE
jgi:putative PIN family toxin of toxin-antitoxin system